jgi:hypothetical protein
VPLQRKWEYDIHTNVLLLTFQSGALYAFGDIGWKYFLVFICIGPIGAALLWKFAPETKGKTLEEIPSMFGDNVDTPELHATRK